MRHAASDTGLKENGKRLRTLRVASGWLLVASNRAQRERQTAHDAAPKTGPFTPVYRCLKNAPKVPLSATFRAARRALPAATLAPHLVIAAPDRTWCPRPRGISKAAWPRTPQNGT